MKIKNITKSQAALEFLMTYGWAIMVFLIAIGALAHFGVLSADKFVPEKCVVEPGIGCTDFKVQEDSVTLVLRNGKGESITLSEIAVGSCRGVNLGPLLNGEQKKITITGCSHAANSKFTGQINITYAGETGLAHKNRGSVVGKVEAGRVIQPGYFEWVVTTQPEFDEGGNSQTESIPEGSVQLISSQPSGAYTSKIFDAGTASKWNYIKWGEPIGYKEHVKPDGSDCASSSIKGMWHLEESSGNVQDSSFCGKNGVNNGASTGVNGKIGNAYDFDGNNDYVDLRPRIFSSAPNELTGMAWVYAKTVGENIAYWQGWGGQFYIGLGNTPSGVGVMGVHQTKSNCGNYNGDWHHFKSSQTYEPNKWHHLAGVYNKAANTIAIYVNGISSGSTDVPLNPNECLSDPPTVHPPTIGAVTLTGGGVYGNFFTGAIDEVVIFGRSLSSSEILGIYKQGILNLYVEVRSCDDPNCNGESFSGSFSDATNNALSVNDNRYFQYKVNFESEDTAYTPILEDVTVGYTIS